MQRVRHFRVAAAFAETLKDLRLALREATQVAGVASLHPIAVGAEERRLAAGRQVDGLKEVCVRRSPSQIRYSRRKQQFTGQTLSAISEHDDPGSLIARSKPGQQGIVDRLTQDHDTRSVPGDVTLKSSLLKVTRDDPHPAILAKRIDHTATEQRLDVSHQDRNQFCVVLGHLFALIPTPR
jgi:hypothetical protein